MRNFFNVYLSSESPIAKIFTLTVVLICAIASRQRAKHTLESAKEAHVIEVAGLARNLS